MKKYISLILTATVLTASFSRVLAANSESTLEDPITVIGGITYSDLGSYSYNDATGNLVNCIYRVKVTTTSLNDGYYNDKTSCKITRNSDNSLIIDTYDSPSTDIHDSLLYNYYDVYVYAVPENTYDMNKTEEEVTTDDMLMSGPINGNDNITLQGTAENGHIRFEYTAPDEVTITEFNKEVHIGNYVVKLINEKRTTCEGVTLRLDGDTLYVSGDIEFGRNMNNGVRISNNTGVTAWLNKKTTTEPGIQYANGLNIDMTDNDGNHILTSLNDKGNTIIWEVPETGEIIDYKTASERNHSTATAPPATEKPTVTPEPVQTTVPEVKTTYRDVPISHWAHDNVEAITAAKAFDGYDDGTFLPEKTITHEEFIKVIVSLIANDDITASAPDYEQLSTDDITHPKYWTNRWSAWAQPYLTTAMKTGIISNTDFRLGAVDTPITREEMAKIIVKALDYLDDETVSDTSGYTSFIADWDSVSDEYKDYLAQAYAKGIINGYEDNSIRPEGNLTRAEASAVVMRFIDRMNTLTTSSVTKNTETIDEKVARLQKEAAEDAARKKAEHAAADAKLASMKAEINSK